ncbi:MAG: hypothetical protein EOM87_05960 [Clostridia bacterium]|nr:hypothetical protein [Clostridia bacterium]
MIKKIIAIIIISCISIAFLSACYDATPYRGVQLPRYDYTLDELGEHITNIPFDEYLYNDAPAGSIFDITDFGAALASADNSGYINAAIDAASDSGGGVVKISGGAYTTSTVILKDNVVLWIERGSALVSLDYAQNKASDNKLSGGVIYAECASNIAIIGGGRIDGRGGSFCEEPAKTEKFLPMNPFSLKKYVLEHRSRIKFEKKNSGRVNLVNIVDCSGVVIKGVELFESACWTLCVKDSEFVEIKDIVINNDIGVANSDGIDIVSSSNVMIEHCFVVTGDDGICIKSNGKNNVSDISITKCTVMSLANCFKIGTETKKDITRITLTDCDFFKAEITGGYSGIAIESCDGANVSELTVSNIRMSNITSPLLIWLGARFMGVDGEKIVGSISNITITDIIAGGVDLPSAIVGVEYRNAVYKVKDISIQNFYIVYREAEQELDISNFPNEISMTGYPEITRVSHIYIINHELSSYWDLPNYGIFRQHTENIELLNINIIPRSLDEERISY